MLLFICVFTVCQCTQLGVSRIQRVKDTDIVQIYGSKYCEEHVFFILNVSTSLDKSALLTIIIFFIYQQTHMLLVLNRTV